MENSKIAMTPGLALQDDLFNSIAQTDMWDALCKADPSIQESDDYFRDLIDQLEATASPEQRAIIDTVCDVHCNSIASWVDIAMLYGMKVSQAFRDMANDPVPLQRYIYERSRKVRDLYQVEVNPRG